MKSSMTFLRLLPVLALPGLAFAQNDECTGAIALAIGTPTAFDTLSATLSPEIWPCAAGGGPDLWYTISPTTSGNLVVDTCGSTYDTALEIFDGTCAALNPIGCNDDSCGLQSTVRVINVAPGQTYYLRVGGWNGSSGFGTLLAEVVQPPQPTGSISAWLSQVNTGTSASFTGTLYPGPSTADIGTRNLANGNTYEIIVNGDNDSGSTGLLGSRVGAADGLKFQQWFNTGEYGVTDFGIADYTFTGAFNTPGVDTHLAFVVDLAGNSTDLYENGVLVGTVPYAPILEGLQGVGQIYDPIGNVDVMASGAVHGLAVYESRLTQAEIQAHSDAYFGGSLGSNYCIATPNSTGVPGEISASGSTVAASNNVTLRASNMPPLNFGIFVTSRTQSFVPNVGSGNLCLGGVIGRYQQPGQIQQIDANGEFSFQIDTTFMPQGTILVPIAAGETWNFQAWHRDFTPTPPFTNTSNLTNGLQITFS